MIRDSAPGDTVLETKIPLSLLLSELHPVWRLAEIYLGAMLLNEGFGGQTSATGDVIAFT